MVDLTVDWGLVVCQWTKWRLRGCCALYIVCSHNQTSTCFVPLNAGLSCPNYVPSPSASHQPNLRQSSHCQHEAWHGAWLSSYQRTRTWIRRRRKLLPNSTPATVLNTPNWAQNPIHSFAINSRWRPLLFRGTLRLPLFQHLLHREMPKQSNSTVIAFPQQQLHKSVENHPHNLGKTKHCYSFT